MIIINSNVCKTLRTSQEKLAGYQYNYLTWSALFQPHNHNDVRSNGIRQAMPTVQFVLSGYLSIIILHSIESAALA